MPKVYHGLRSLTPFHILTCDYAHRF